MWKSFFAPSSSDSHTNSTKIGKNRFSRGKLAQTSGGTWEVVFLREKFYSGFFEKQRTNEKKKMKEVKDRNRKFNCFCWREMVMTITAVWGWLHVETLIHKRRLKSMTLKRSKKSEWEILHPGEHIFHLTSQTLWKYLAVWHPWWCRMENGETNLHRMALSRLTFRFSRWKARNIDESARHFPRSTILHGHLSCATWKITLMCFILIKKLDESTRDVLRST